MVAEVKAWEAEDGTLHRTRLQAEAAEAQAKIDRFHVWLGSRVDLKGPELDSIVQEIWRNWDVKPREYEEAPH